MLFGVVVLVVTVDDSVDCFTLCKVGIYGHYKNDDDHDDHNQRIIHILQLIAQHRLLHIYKQMMKRFRKKLPRNLLSNRLDKQLKIYLEFFFLIIYWDVCNNASGCTMFTLLCSFVNRYPKEPPHKRKLVCSPIYTNMKKTPLLHKKLGRWKTF